MGQGGFPIVIGMGKRGTDSGKACIDTGKACIGMGKPGADNCIDTGKACIDPRETRY